MAKKKQDEVDEPAQVEPEDELVEEPWESTDEDAGEPVPPDVPVELDTAEVEEYTLVEVPDELPRQLDHHLPPHIPETGDIIIHLDKLQKTQRYRLDRTLRYWRPGTWEPV